MNRVSVHAPQIGTTPRGEVVDVELVSSSSPLSLAAVTCGLPPIPKNALLTYEMIFTANNPSVYGDIVSYQCLPPLALLGNKTATCTHQGVWSEPPVCQRRP